MKSCNGCTLCCHLVPVKEIGLKAFNRCPHLNNLWAAQPGCSIYSHRPFSCRHWSCLWIRNNEWDEDLKPSRCGIVFDEVPDIIKINGKEYSVMQGWVKAGMPKRFWINQPILAVVLAILARGQAMLFRLDDDTAFAVFRNDDGVICCNEDNPIRTLKDQEPDRQIRAYKMARYEAP